MPGCLQFERRGGLPTQVGRLWATAGEHATHNALLQAWYEARDLRQTSAAASQRRAELRHCPEEALSVGMARTAEQLRGRRFLHLASRIHDDDMLRHLSHHAQV